MERLNENVLGNIQLKACGNDFCKETCAEHDEEKSCDNCPIQKAFEKLAEYEDLEEQGKLLKLPCAVGTPVYMIAQDCGGDTLDCRSRDCENCEYLYSFVEENKFETYMCKEIGKTVFLTKSAAERALKEMEGKK